jgi:hypothetical protein
LTPNAKTVPLQSESDGEHLALPPAGAQANALRTVAKVMEAKGNKLTRQGVRTLLNATMARAVNGVDQVD